MNSLNLQTLLNEKKARDFGLYCKQITPHFNWEWEHLKLIRSYLQRVYTGDLLRLMIFTPPRHGKSEQVTVRFPAFYIERYQDKKVIIGAYNQSLASKFSRKTRNIVENRIGIALDRRSADDWETLQGGSLRGVGVGSGITGHGGDLIIIDDPVKNREEANSEVYREKVWEWFTDDLYTRLEPGGAIILIMTRWHEDDLAGRILLSESGKEWEILRLPAFCESQDARDNYAEKISRKKGFSDPLNREIGKPLCRERFDVDALNSIKTAIGSNTFEALYQQNPIKFEGNLFKIENIKIVDNYPSDCKFIRYWDKAGTEDGGAQTAGVKMGRSSLGEYFVIDVKAGQWSALNREKIIKQCGEVDGNGVVVWIEQEPGSGGKESAEATVRGMAGYPIFADKVTGDKITRAEPYAAQVEAGNVFLVRGEWNRSYIDQLQAFPFGKLKDKVDASSGAFNKLANIKPKQFGGGFEPRV